LKSINVLYKDLGADSTAIGNEENDIVIYAEGNVRVHGEVSADPTDPNASVRDKAPRHVTIVTNGTAYIDGSLLKGHRDSSIAVLAHDYVCVNTTQFVAGKTPNPFPGQDPGGNVISQTAGTVQPNVTSTSAPSSVNVGVSVPGNIPEILQEFSMGMTAGETQSYAGSQYLYLSANVQSTLTPAGTNMSPLVTIWQNGTGIATSAPVIPGTFVDSTEASYTHIAYPTAGLGAATIGPFLQLGFSVPAGYTSPLSVERVGIFPADVRIEAVLYAQTRSFFVIPGQWFNTDTVDTTSAFLANGFTARHPNWTNTASNLFPFYGQPVDLKITIAGAISEAETADEGAQLQWMQHWGWIPFYQGSSGVKSGHSLGGAPGVNPVPGLTIIYDPLAGDPIDTSAATPVYYRQDGYNNPLPFAPVLPVCPGLIYTDEESGLVQ
jgi:hypothetical protein